MKNIKVVFMGTPEFSVPVLAALIDNTNVVGIVTQPDKGNIPPVKKLALEKNIKVFQPSKIRTEYDDILSLNPDIIVTCAYGQIIPKDILDYPKLGCINIHASLLPKLRGGAPIHRAILEGYKETGITIMYMDESMDTGDIISMESITIGDNETVGSLHDRLKILGRDLFMKTLPIIVNGNVNRIQQKNEEATYAYNIKRIDEKIDWNETKEKIHNQIRGLNPFPGSYSLLDDKILKIWESQVSEEKTNGENGEIVKLDSGIHVKVSNGSIIIKSLQLEGKRKMNYKEFINGRNLIGKILR